MTKLKIFLMILLATIFVVNFEPVDIDSAYAQARYSLRKSRPREATGIFVDASGNNMDYGVWVYGISILADEANSFMGVYDADTEAEVSDGTTVKDEVGEATQYDTAEKKYTTPEYYSDGVFAVMATGVGFVQYGPEP